ncbi:MAG TPA: 4Fe-4S dicluster domain-containing protein, partial [Amaricoccus sp.]|nr:4Fe-4S dicluster domain-containing protein [Amaricoccus sp.]
GLFLFTSALGRVWCGYACPQTVWTDLFILVERWIEGDRNARVRLWHAPWTATKIRLRAIKWTVWLLIALATGGAWVFYFADAPTLLRQLVTLEAAPVAYFSIALLTATTFALGGFLREQVCIYMCPWPRIQAAMMDEHTMTVAYREWRGEPRGKGTRRRASAAAEVQAAGPEGSRHSPLMPQPGLPTGVGGPIPAKEGYGDCIDCNACVNVCPTGIDIRDGQQLACITCALCIDACDDVMDRIGKPRGLIGYVTLADGERERAGAAPVPVWRRILRPRVLIYTLLWSGIGIGLIAALLLRTDMTIAADPVRNPVNVTLSDGSIRNTYEVRLRNMTGYDRVYRLSAHSEFPVALEVQNTAGLDVTVPANSTLRQRIYLTSAPASAAGAEALMPVTLIAEDTGSGNRASERTVFHGRQQ